MIFSLLSHGISFFFSHSLSRPPPSFFSQPFSLLFLSISASLTIRQAAHLSSGTNAAHLRRSPLPMPLQATCLHHNLPDLTKIRFTSSTRQQLTSSTRQVARLSSDANAARLCQCRSPSSLLHLHRCCRNLPDLTKIRFPYLFGLFMVDFGDWIWFEKLDWRITMIWDGF